MLTDSFLDFIDQEKLFKKEDHLLLAISGGVDSVVLSYLLHQTGFKFSLAHMNFQLRGNDSELDQKFVEDLAEQLNVNFHVKRVHIQKGQNNQGSTQMQARELRYTWFNHLLKSHSYTKLLTAHHAEDSFETVILNLTRGTGIRGVRGILPLSENVARPLLFTDKTSILDYAKKNDLSWREDISNHSDAYKRNEVRHHIIPRLRKQNPSLFEGFKISSLKLRAVEAAFDSKMSDLTKGFVKFKNEEITISKNLLKLEFGQVYLAEFLDSYQFTYQQLSAFSFDQSGAYLESRKFTLIVDRDNLILKPKAEKMQVFTSLNFENKKGAIMLSAGREEFQLKWELIESINFKNSIPSNVAIVDYGLIKNPVILRTWKEGDKMKPLGMKGNKKVSDILIDDKISVPDKEKYLVLESDGEIVWLLNNRVSENFKVTKQTSAILRLEYYKM